jgi:hypothetical protein
VEKDIHFYHAWSWLEDLTREVRQQKEIKGMQVEGEN